MLSSSLSSFPALPLITLSPLALCSLSFFSKTEGTFPLWPDTYYFLFLKALTSFTTQLLPPLLVFVQIAIPFTVRLSLITMLKTVSSVFILALLIPLILYYFFITLILIHTLQFSLCRLILCPHPPETDGFMLNVMTIMKSILFHSHSYFHSQKCLGLINL